MSLPPSKAGLSQITVIVDFVIMVTLGLDGSLGGTAQNHYQEKKWLYYQFMLNT